MRLVQQRRVAIETLATTGQLQRLMHHVSRLCAIFGMAHGAAAQPLPEGKLQQPVLKWGGSLADDYRYTVFQLALAYACNCTAKPLTWKQERNIPRGTIVRKRFRCEP